MGSHCTLMRNATTWIGKQIHPSIILAGVASAVAGCASQPIAAGHDHPAFFAGLIHGLTALFTLLSSPFFHYRIYAYPNSGLWYDLGFCFGFSTTVTVLLLIAMPFLGGFMTRRN